MLGHCFFFWEKGFLFVFFFFKEQKRKESLFLVVVSHQYIRKGVNSSASSGPKVE